jgi:hypothetical protein
MTQNQTTSNSPVKPLIVADLLLNSGIGGFLLPKMKIPKQKKEEQIQAQLKSYEKILRRDFEWEDKIIAEMILSINKAIELYQNKKEAGF